MSGLFGRGLAIALATLALGAHAGGPLSVCNGVPTKYAGTGTIALHYDQGPLGTRSKAQADALVTAAIANWTNVATSTVSLSRSTDLPVDVTSLNYLTYLGGSTFSDGLNPVVYDNDGSIIDLLLGAGSSNSVLGFAGSAWTVGSTCTYREGRAVINGARAVSDTTMRVVLAHEIGHLIGLDHSQLDSDQGLSSPNYPLMYPIASRGTDALHEDDIAAVTALYPGSNVSATYGELTGRLTQGNGTAVRGANVWAVETTTGRLYSVVSDYLSQGTGYFQLLLPAGTYHLRAGAIRSNFNGGSSVGPYSENTSDISFQAPLYSGTSRMATVTLGGSSPTPITIVPGCAASATFRLDGTGSVSGNCVAAPVTLTVTKSGTGSGTVSSNPTGISCGGTCSANFASGAGVTLSATPAAGSVFAGWGGACSGSGGCTVTLSAARSVTAAFNLSTPASPNDLLTRYRLYSPATLEHLYTTDFNEYTALPTCCGWLPEGAIYRVLRGPGTYNGVTAVPYYRLYNPFSFQHHWTTDANEYSVLPQFGWIQEGIDGYVLPTQAAGTLPLYRLYINAQGGLHLWTTDANEVAYLTANAGWVSEGIAGYVVPLP